MRKKPIQTAPIDLTQFFEPEPEAEPQSPEPIPTEPEVDAALNATVPLSFEEAEALQEPIEKPPVRPSAPAKAKGGDIILRKSKKYLVIERDGQLYVRRMGFSKITKLWQDNCYRIWKPKTKKEN